MPAIVISILLLCTSLSAATPSAISVGTPANVSLSRVLADSSGSIYAAGTELLTTGTSTKHSIFVTKIDSSGAPAYTTVIGGTGDDIATSMAIDAKGRLYCVGHTTSPDFPLRNAIQSERSTLGTTGFVFALDSGGQMLWSTYFGGSGTPYFFATAGNSVQAVAVDAVGNAYISGTSQTPNLTTTPGAFQPLPNFSATFTERVSKGFVAKFSPVGQLVYSTWLAGDFIYCHYDACGHNGPRIDSGTAIAVDQAGSAYVFGYTDSADFPVTPGSYQTQLPPSGLLQTYNAFLTKLKPDGSALVYSTFLGTFGHDYNPPAEGLTHGIAIDSEGNTTVAFGTTGPFTEDFGGVVTTPIVPRYAQLMTVNSSGTALNASIALTAVTANDDRFVNGMALGSDGAIYIAGSAGVRDLLTKVSINRASTAETTVQLPRGTAGQDIALAPNNTLLAVGTSGRLLQLDPLNPSALPPLLGAGNAANWSIDGAFTTSELISLYGTNLGPAVPVVAVPDISNPLSPRYPETLGGFQVAVNGIAAELLYVSANQINLVLPALASSPVDVTISAVGFTSGPLTIGAASAVATPGIFRNSDGSAAALNQGGTLNTLGNPARVGDIISLWGTGIIPSDFHQVTVTANSGTFPVRYAGPAPGLVSGVFQINTEITGTSYGSVPVALSIRGNSSPAVTVFVTP